ncbi:MAG TPA: hypothetical protein VE263_02745 [Candidatus Angelobacter sp.]|nr:hypothetical protein [Candidatus Angelobacter sp.]
MNRVRCLLLVGIVVVGLAAPTFAQQQANQPASTPPLVQLLQSKGILTPDEAATISQASSADEANARLAQLLYSKGVISKQDYDQMLVPSLVQTGAVVGQPHLVNAAIHVAPKAPPSIPSSGDLGMEPGFSYGSMPAETGVIPAVAPVRVLPIEIPKQGGLIPDIKLGSGANIKIYGFFKMSAIEETANPGGAAFGPVDFPLPMLIGGDTGPTSGPQFRIKDRQFRIGSMFEWVPKGSDLVITGRLETDFEGDYTQADNVNISGVRNSQLRIRLAYVRLDTKFADLPVFAEFGQDWTILGSSTLPNVFETTGNLVGLGNIYTRTPQIKVGAQFSHGDFKFEPEFAILLASSADGTLTSDQRTRFGDFAGASSNQPAVEGRLVFQMVLNHDWQGVAPAQFIVSGHHANIDEIIPGQALAAPAIGTNGIALNQIGLPTTATTGADCGATVFACFPRGVQREYPQNVFTVEAQVPTPWVTAVAKWYKGGDLRWFFAGQLNTAFTAIPEGVVNLGTGASFSGVPVLFQCPEPIVVGNVCSGTVTPGSLEPIRGQGGFAQLSFPLSRIFHADPEGHNAGWTFQVLYGTDRAKREDVVRSGGNGLMRTDTGMGTLSYKLNKWVTFVDEVTYYETRTGVHVVDEERSPVKKFQGVNVTAAHNWVNEFGTVVTF